MHNHSVYVVVVIVAKFLTFLTSPKLLHRFVSNFTDVLSMNSYQFFFLNRGANPILHGIIGNFVQFFANL